MITKVRFFSCWLENGNEFMTFLIASPYLFSDLIMCQFFNFFLCIALLRDLACPEGYPS